MKVLAATKALEVLETLSGKEGVELVQALYTGQICDALEGARLVIIDFEDLVPHPRSIDYVKGVLASSNAHVYTSEAFLQQPEYLLEKARQEAGEITRLPDKMVIALVSYSGGTGKTTLAIDTALHFARRTRKPVFLTEFVYGKSSLTALTRLDMPHLFELATQVGVEATQWEGVTLAPMDYDYGSLLTRDVLSNYLNRQLQNHVLSVIDARWPHALLDVVADAVDLWLIVTSPRADALENAEKLKAELEERLGQAAEPTGSAMPYPSAGPRWDRRPVRTAIVLNQKGGLVDSLALAGTHFDLELGRIAQPDGRWDGRLGRQILGLVYKDSWKQFERPKVLARIAGRLGQALGRRRPLSPLRALGLWIFLSFVASVVDLFVSGGIVRALWLAVGLLIIPAFSVVDAVQRRLPAGGRGLYKALAGWAILTLMFLGMGLTGWYDLGWAIYPIAGAAVWPLYAFAAGRVRRRRWRVTLMGWVILALVFLVLDMVLDGWVGLQWAGLPILASAAWPLFGSATA